MTATYAKNSSRPVPEPSAGAQRRFAPGSRAATWAGRSASYLALAFLLFDAMGKVLRIAPAIEGTSELGYSTEVLVPLGIVELVCAALYALPRTSVLGALLWTGYLGGAVATHVRVDNPLFSHVLFPIYVALLLWGGLWLRDARLRALLPLRDDA